MKESATGTEERWPIPCAPARQGSTVDFSQTTVLSGGPSLGVKSEYPCRQGDHYTPLNAALQHLQIDPDNAEASLSALHSYTALGLIGPALELISEGGGPLASMHEFRELRDQLSRMPSGRIPGQTLTKRFESNLGRVYEAHPGLRRHDDELRRSSRSWELYRTMDGNLQLSTRPSRGPRQWLPNPCNAKRLAADLRLPHDPGQLFCGPYLIACDHVGVLLNRVFSETRQMFMTFTPRLYFIEPEIRLFGATLHAAEKTDSLCDPRTTILIGPDCIDELVDTLITSPDRAIPDYVIQFPGRPPAIRDEILAALRRVTESRQRRGHETIQTARRHYDGLPEDHWRDRFPIQGAQSLRVLGITSRFTTVLQYAMRDLKGAFERSGHTFRLLIEKNDHDLMPPAHIAEAVEEYRPDLIFVIDHLWREYPRVIPANVPFVCWIQDRMPHLFKKEAGRGVGLMEFVIGHGFPECLTEYDYPVERFYPCTIPTSADRLLDPDERPEALLPYRCDVMYATHATATPEELHHQHRQRFDGRIRALVDAVHETLMSVARRPDFCGDYDYDGLVARVETESDHAIEDHALRGEIVAMQRFIAHQFLREQTIEAAARWSEETGGTFHLYGKGWENRPRTARFARGSLEHGIPLGRAFRAAKISLHTGCNSALHQRVLDGLCAGGFFLIQEKPSDTAHALNAAIHQYVCENGWTLPFQLRPADLPGPHDTAYHRFLEIRGNDPEMGVTATRDMLLNLRAECDWGWLPRASRIWPRYERVVYRGAQRLAERIDYFIRNEDERLELANEMRGAVLKHFTYDALVRSVLKHIGHFFAGRGRSILEA
ncbi:MAG: glycosyltransferase [Phycisphaerae bacterium]